MLIKLKNFIKQHSPVNMQELLTAFNIDEYNMRKILKNWTKKGMIKSSEGIEPCCARRNNCKSCSLLSFEYYSIIN